MLAILGLLLLLVVSVLIFRPTFNLERLRPRIESALTETIGAPVSIRDTRLRTSLWPTLAVSDVRLATIDQQGSSDIARVGRLEAQISLLPLLRRRLAIQRLRIEGVALEARSALALVSHEGQNKEGTSGWALVAVKELEGVDIVVHYDSAEDRPHELDVASVTGGVSQTKPFELKLIGRLDEAKLRVDLEGPPIGDLLDPPTVLPLTAELELGELFASTQIRASPSRFILEDLQGELDESPYSGSLDIELATDRPSISGALDLERLRLSRWLPDKKADTTSDAIEPVSPRESISRIEVPYDLLEVLDVDLDLGVDRIDGLPLVVEGLDTHIGLQSGELDLPVSLELEGAQVEARAKIDAENRLSLDSELTGFPLDRLQALSNDLTPLSGSIGNLSLTATTTGPHLAALIEQFSADLEVESSSLLLTAPHNDRQLDLEIRSLKVRRRPAERLRIDLQGSLLGQSLHLISNSQNLIDLEIGKPWPVDLSVQSLSLDSQLSATLTPNNAAPIISAEFRITGDRLADLHDWLGIPEHLDVAFGLAGTGYLAPRGSRVSIADGWLGQSRFSAELSFAESPTNHLSVDIEVSNLDLPELTSLAQRLEDERISNAPLSLDLPILPTSIKLPDTDLEVTVARIVRRPKDIVDLDMSAEIIEGRLEPSTLSFQAGNSRIRGTAQLDWVEEMPQIDLDLQGDNLDVADWLDTDLIADGLTIRADGIDLAFRSKGRTLRRLLSLASDWRIAGQGIEATMPLELSDDDVELYLDELEIEAPEGQAMSADAVGSLNGLKVDLSAEASPAPGFEFGDDLPIEVIATFDDIHTGLQGAIGFPLDIYGQQLRLSLDAPMLSSFNRLLETDLPAVGPVRFAASLIPMASGFDLDIEDLEVGGSALGGSISLDTTGERLRADATLDTTRLQLNDYLPEPAEASNEKDGATDLRSDPIRFPDVLEWLRAFDGSLSLAIDELVWGDQVGGGGSIRAQLEGGHLTLSELDLVQQDSEVELQADLILTDSGLETELGLRLDEFRYGPLAQAINPNAEEDGTVAIDTAVRMNGKTLDELIASGSGHFDFTLYPHAVNTEVLDLWAAGISSVLRVFNPNQESVLNCITGRFSIADGIMTADSSFLDTSQIRARGKGEIDLPRNRIQMKFQPRPKRRTFLNLATPVRVSGPLQDPDMRVGLKGLAGTAFRIYTWAITVFFEVFRQPLPADGADICVAPDPRVEVVTAK